MKDEGFTLIEVLISVTILSIILFSFMGIYLQSTKIEHTNHNQLVAINLAQATLHRLKNGDFEHINTIGTYQLESCVNPGSNSCLPIINDKNYQAKITIYQSASGVELKLASIEITEKNNSQILATLEGYLPNEEDIEW